MLASVRITSHLSKLGWFTIIGATLLVSTAFVLEYAYAVYLGCGLIGASLISLLVGRRQLHHIRSRWLLPPSPHAGQFNTIGAELSSDVIISPITLYAYEPRSERSQLVSPIPGLQKELSRITWPIFFPQRGHFALPPLELVSEQPFGLIRNHCQSSPISRLIVLPAYGSMKKELHIELENWLHHKRLPTPNGTDELVRLRPYQHGDSPRLVHWRASARSKQLIVSVRSDISDFHVSLVLDCTCKQKQSRRFERLVSMAATIIDHAHHHGWSLSLHGYFSPKQGLFQSRQKLMECLALVESTEHDPVETYIPKQQHALVLTLNDNIAERIESACKILSLSELEAYISLARERR